MTMSGAAARKYAIENGKLPDKLTDVEGNLDLTETEITRLP